MKMRVGERLKREGIYVNIQLIHFVVELKLTQHCKAVILQFFKKNTISQYNFKNTFSIELKGYKNSNQKKYYGRLEEINYKQSCLN